MSYQVKDLIEYFKYRAPQQLAEEWDNVGLLLGNSYDEMKRILVCLDVTKAVTEEAIIKKADIILSHHPLIFKGLKRIDETSAKGAVIYSLIKNGISVYSAHTNLDVSINGVNDVLGKLIGLSALKDLNSYKSFEDREYGLGKVGELEAPMDFQEFILMVKEKLKVGNIRIIGEPDNKIKRVAVFCGSFDEDYSGILRHDADVLLTGDLKYHAASDIREMGLCAVDAGHFYTERIIVPELVKELAEKFPGLEVIGSTVEADPFKFT